MYKRLLEMNLPKKQSAFLWGARKTGKSTYLKQRFPKSIYYDFLKSDEYLRYSKAPYKFREELLALKTQQERYHVIIDEVQKVPQILDEVHWLIENAGISFILCGSSARKLKRTGANLLGGRAWKYHFFPLVYSEITDFSLLKILNQGCIPAHYQTKNVKKALKAYIEDYLVHEIQAEGLVRNLPGFARFLDIMPFSNGEMINFTNISREVGIDAKTVKEYFNILEDTLLGYFIYPYSKKVKRDIITSQPKFYLFDVGLATNLSKNHFETIEGSQAGKALENYILQEIIAYNSMKELDYKINYWRTKNGLEVDFLINEKIAIEVKVSENIHPTYLNGLKALNEELKIDKSIIVCMEPKERLVKSNNCQIKIMPIELFLKELWKGSIF
jgi:predicted AAA+ superfamily ATPase